MPERPVRAVRPVPLLPAGAAAEGGLLEPRSASRRHPVGDRDGHRPRHHGGLVVVSVTEATVIPARPAGEPDTPREIDERRGRGDRIFHGGASMSGAFVLAIMVRRRRVPRDRGARKPCVRRAGRSSPPPSGSRIATSSASRRCCIGTVLIAVVAVVDRAADLDRARRCSSPRSHPRGCARSLVALVDLMAAVPSVVYGLWGLFLLQGQIVGVVPMDQHLVRLDARSSRSRAPTRTTRCRARPCTPRRRSSPASSWR